MTLVAWRERLTVSRVPAGRGRRRSVYGTALRLAGCLDVCFAGSLADCLELLERGDVGGIHSAALPLLRGDVGEFHDFVAAPDDGALEFATAGAPAFDGAVVADLSRASTGLGDVTGVGFFTGFDTPLCAANGPLREQPITRSAAIRVLCFMVCSLGMGNAIGVVEVWCGSCADATILEEHQPPPSLPPLRAPAIFARSLGRTEPWSD